MKQDTEVLYVLIYIIDLQEDYTNFIELYRFI